jgi:hypothetical protein
VRAALTIAALFLPAGAAAQEKDRDWSVEVGASLVALGNERPTGGWSPSLSARRVLWRPDGEMGRWSVHGGARVSAFNFSSWRWLALVAGPTSSVEARVTRNWSAGLDLSLDLGQIPVCNDGDICLRWWGLFPRAQVGVTYEAAPGVSVTAAVGVRYVNTLAWEGVSWEPAAVGRFGW